MTTQDIDLGVVARGPKGDKGDKGDTGDRGPQGPKGEQGNVGPAPTLKIGTVTKLNPDQAPTASFSGGNGSYTLDLGIPQGETNATATNALNKVTAIQANGGGRNLIANTGTDIVIDATSANAGNYTFVELNFAEQPKQGDLITVSAEGTLTGTGTLDEYQVVLYNWVTTNQRSQAQYLKAGKRDSVTLSLDNLNGVGDTALLIYAGKAGETKGKKNVIHHLMVEKSTVAHEWQPAPEDIQSEIDANKTAAANAQNTANSAIKVSETLKDLGNYTATASGTTANSPTTGLPRSSGVSMSEVYDNGYPTSYGNVLNVAGAGAGQLLLGWSGNDNTTEHLWYRSHRDTSTGGWGTWQKIAYVSDLTWSNISGKPDVATKPDVSSALTVANTAKSTADSALSKANSNATALDSKANKSDLTWANISGKPSIPDDDATTTVSSGDLNNYTTTGKYYMPSALANYTNHPTTGTDMSDWFVMKVDAYQGADMIVQTIYQINSGDVWIRHRRESNWKSWRQINFWS